MISGTAKVQDASVGGGSRMGGPSLGMEEGFAEEVTLGSILKDVSGNHQKGLEERVF